MLPFSPGIDKSKFLQLKKITYDFCRSFVCFPPSIKVSVIQVFRPTGLNRLNVIAPNKPQHHKECPKRKSMFFLKRLKKYFRAFFKLGHIERIAKNADRASHENAARAEEIIEILTLRLNQATRDQNAQMDEHKIWIKGRLAEHVLRDNELSRRLNMLAHDSGSIGYERPQSTQSINPATISEGLRSFLDTFYNQLEYQCRGSQEEILDRLRVYQPDVINATDRTGGKPVLDLACGRGEWLVLMRELGIEATGVDINEVQISGAREDNLNVYHKDAFEALRDAENDSLSIISANHFIEHISFPQLAWLVLEAQRALAPGGLLVLETPNPANLIVGATNFYIDPTHKRPLPSQLLKTLFDAAGFIEVETRYLHPGGNLDAMLSQSGVNYEIAQLLFGPQDLAILGKKPGQGG